MIVPTRRVALLPLFLLALLSLTGCHAIFGLFAGPPYEPQPIPTAATAGTARQLQQKMLAFNLRTTVDAYQTSGNHSPAWDDAAVKFLREYARLFSDVPDARTPKALLPGATSLLSSGCDDPLVLYCCGCSLQDAGQEAEAVPILQRALRGLEQSKYPPIRAAFAARRLACIVQKHEPDGPSQADDYWSVAFKHFGEAARAKTYADGEQRLFLSHLMEDWDSMDLGQQRSLYDALKDHADPYVVNVIEGKLEVERAWAARGDDWASEVTDKAWRRFEQHLENAARVLTEAWKLHPEFPEAPAEMIRVASGASGWEDDTRLWFDRAVAAQLDYSPAYDTLLWFMHPRWGGSHKQMYAFGLECLETGRFDTLVPLYFFDILRRISEDLDWATTFWDKPGTYEHLESIFAGYAKAAPASRKPWYLSCQAACEWHFAHYEDARRLLEELGDQVDTTVFPTFFNRPFGRARGEIYAFTSPASDSIQRAEKLVESGHLDSALALLRKQTSTPSLHRLAAVYLEQRIASVTFLQDFQAGKWVNLQPDPDFSGWIKDKGEWVIDPDGAIKGTSTQDGLWLLCDADVGTRFEYRGEMELVASPRQYVPNCGVIFACTGFMEWDFLVFLASKQEQQTMLSHNLWDEETVYGKPQVSGRDTFHIKVWDDTVTTYLNGRLVNKNFPAGKEDYAGRVAVGVGSSCDGPGVVTRFRNLQLRRLTSRPDPSAVP